MNAELIVMDDAVLVDDDGNVLVVVLVDDELINVNDVIAIYELRVTSLKLLNSRLIILE